MPNIIERTQNEEPKRSEKLECDTLSQRVYLFHHYNDINLSKLVQYAERIELRIFEYEWCIRVCECVFALSTNNIYGAHSRPY